MLNFFIVIFAADETLDAVDGVFWVGDALTLSNFTDKAVAFFGDGDY